MIHIDHEEAQESKVSFSFRQHSYTIDYPCQSYSTCSPYKITFGRGIYKLKIWGASGGSCLRDGITSEGGKGGYATGALIVHSPSKILFLHLGGHHDTSDSDSIPLPCYNGGGSPALNIDGPGGGASDFRTQNGNWTETLSSRILVAGGGGGGRTIKPNRYIGGNGGGETGTEGQGETTPSRYGTPDGVDGAEPTSSHQDGKFGVGGSGWGTGGGGWFGGSTHENAAGGGGSGHINPTEIVSYFDVKASTSLSEHVGAGRAIITILRNIPCTFGNRHIRLSLSTLIFTLCFS